MPGLGDRSVFSEEGAGHMGLLEMEGVFTSACGDGVCGWPEANRVLT